MGRGTYVHKCSNEVIQDWLISVPPIYEEDEYTFVLRGLHPALKYSVTLDSLNSTFTVEGLRLLQGLPIRLKRRRDVRAPPVSGRLEPIIPNLLKPGTM
jgi:hypothetical protein